MQSTSSASSVIYRILRDSPLLVDDQLGTPTFDRNAFQRSNPLDSLNLNQKLGHVYEDALAALISNAPTLELIARNLQIFDTSGRTLGELDFVFYDFISKKHIHLELAIKFYLSHQKDNTWHFPGPDPRDNWQRKLDRMRTHQFKLASTPEAQALLKEKFEIKTIETKQLIYGRLFDPIGTVERPHLISMASNANRGQWLYLKDWEEHFPDTATVSSMPKQLWPLEITSETRPLLKPTSIDDLKNAAAHRCTMFTTTESAEPYFLVPNSWPTPEQR